MAKRFIIKLSAPLIEAQGKPELKTIYKIAQKTGVAFNTVKKYIAGDVTSSHLSSEVIQLCEFFGLDWRNDRNVVEVVETSEDVDEQIKTLLAVTA